MLLLDQNVGHTPTQTRAERAGTMVRDLRRLGVPTALARLEFGDASFQGWGPDREEVPVGIELKTVGGLLGDMVSGRFAGHQLPGMQRMYRYRYLVVEGAMRPSISDGMLEVPRGPDHWWSPSPRIMFIDFMKWLDDIRLRAGFHVWHTWTQQETLHFVASEYLGWRKPWEQHRGLCHFNEGQPGGVVLMRPPSLLRLWARDLPGIGWDRSEAAERHFRTPLQMAQAPESEWRTIPGIGKITASRVWKAIRGLR